jgi:Flp pilus assembly protein TadG
MAILDYAKSKRGQSVVEFTLAAPLFFLAFYAIIEFSHLFYVRSTVQHALDEAARYMSTGQGQDSTNPNGPAAARLDAVQRVFCNNLVATGIACPTLTAIAPDGNLPGKFVTLTATVTKPFFTGFFGIFDPTGVQMTVTTIYQNEPYLTVNPG